MVVSVIDDSLQPIDIPADEVGGWRVEEEFINAIRGEEIITHTDFGTGLKYMAFTEAVTQQYARTLCSFDIINVSGVPAVRLIICRGELKCTMRNPKRKSGKPIRLPA